MTIKSTLTYDSLVIKALEEAAGLLLRESNNRHLREVQKCIWKWKEQASEYNREASICFLMFFLETFMDRVFYNLAGDVPYIKGITENIQDSFYKKVGKLLQQISDDLKQKRNDQVNGCFAEMAKLYYDTVDLLNDAYRANPEEIKEIDGI